MSHPSISVIITSHDEGQELTRTLRSVLRHTQQLAEILVIDDGSSDDSCQNLPADRVRVLRHDRRIGVAYSRDEGSRAARGDVLCFLDAHQRVSQGCLDRCAQVAFDREAIASPDLRDFGYFHWRLHGANFRLCPQRKFFSAQWRTWFTLPGITSVSGLRAPPYLIPRHRYADVAWSRKLRGWGASEASLAVQAFFVGMPIWHLAGPLALHRFQTQFPYATSWHEVWRNQAIIARICFDENTWRRYWLPRVFDQHLNDEVRAELEDAEIVHEHEAFLTRKVRTDHQFWIELAQQPPPLES